MSTIRHLGPDVTPTQLMTLDDRIARQMAPQQFGVRVLTTLGIIALLLALMGVYVLGESMAAIRMREMGIRAALGATRRELAAIVVQETARLVLVVLIVGLGFVWFGASTIRSLLFSIEPLDAANLATVAGSILALTILMSLRPALRAARVDVARTLKE